MWTSQDVTINFREYGDIVVPKGTMLTNQTATGIDKKYHFVNEYKWIKKSYPKIANILIHDATHYGINIPKEFVIFRKTKT